jgi:hypothetical protein
VIVGRANPRQTASGEQMHGTEEERKEERRREERKFVKAVGYRTR